MTHLRPVGTPEPGLEKRVVVGLSEDDAGNDVFSRALALQLKTKKVSASELARRLEIDRSTVHYWLGPKDPKKRTSPRVEELPLIAEKLGCSVVDLITDPDVPPKIPLIDTEGAERSIRDAFAKIGYVATIKLKRKH